jgi:uroporphyrinogen decarboxylase
MNPRERLLMTLSHIEPDKVPMTARLWLDTKTKLKKHYNIQSDEKLFEKLGVDSGKAEIQVAPPTNWRPNEELLRFCEATGYEADSQYTSYEEWNIKRRLGKKTPGRMLQQYHFTHHPWAQFTEVGEISEVELPDLDAEGRFKKIEDAVRALSDSKVIFGDLGHCQFTKAWELRGFTNFLKDLHINLKMAKAILDRLNNYYLEVTSRFFDLGVEGIRLSEDWGNNKSMFINPNLWIKVFKPRYKRIFQRAKRSGGYISFHSDGNITPIVEELVDLGVDILNPIQPECMDQLEIKRKYGDKLTIDTGISVQKTLPFGTLDEVKNEAKKALKHLAPGGGFIYGTSHYALNDVPVENIVTFYETCKEYGRYPIRIP